MSRVSCISPALCCRKWWRATTVWWSIWARSPSNYAYAGGNVYGGTKDLVRQFTQNLRSDLVGYNVRATDIEPGMVGGSEFSLVRFDGDAAKAADGL